MADDWYYAQNQDRRGPVSFAKLKTIAADGWLRREDLVWHAGMTEWTAAEKVPGLFASSLGQILQDTIAGVRAPVEAKPAEAQPTTQPPGIPAEMPKPVQAKNPDPNQSRLRSTGTICGPGTCWPLAVDSWRHSGLPLR
jgi:hypothetical protein